MIVHFLYLLLGSGLLAMGAEALVRGSSALALRLKVVLTMPKSLKFHFRYHRRYRF